MSLSVRDRLKRKKEQKMQNERDLLAASIGIYFSPELKAEKDRYPFLKYLINALILFGGTFGSIDCIITAFHLEVTIIPLLVTCIIGSLVLSFMYTSHKAKIGTYLVILVGVILMAFGGFNIINSGISALRNNILSYIDTKEDLPFLREFNVRFEDEFTAMSFALCAIAVAMMILINIVVSEKMSLRGLFCLTFPIAQFGMYFNYDTSKPAMLLVVSSWILTAAINFSGGYDGLTRKMVSESTVKKHRHRYGFVTDSNNLANIAGVWLGLILAVTGLVFVAIPNQNFELNLRTDKVKDSTERVVKNFLSYGMSAMWSRTRSGDDPGALSNASQITFDGRTDLKVTVVNPRADRLYLRNFVGYDYDSYNMCWIPPHDNEEAEKRFNYTAAKLKKDFETDRSVCLSKHKIGIKVVDYELMKYPLDVPYYSFVEDDIHEYATSGEISLKEDAGTTANDTQYYTFYMIDEEPEDYTALTETDAETAEIIRRDAYENALTVPEETYEAVKKFCDVYKIGPDDKDAVEKVISALERDFEYTLKPGKVPYGEDYINYFLMGSQKGYCQHFASAVTLIFRYLGIPARYVEGYAIDREDFFNSTMVENEDVSQWVEAYYKTEPFVSAVAVPDYAGHAWVEIYKDGIGWIPVEATTAPSADSGRNLLAEIFSGPNSLTSLPRDMIEKVRQMNAENTTAKLAALGLAIWYLIRGVYFLRLFLLVIKRHRGFYTKKNRVNLNNRYKHLVQVWQFAYNDKVNYSYLEFFALLKEKELLPENCDELAEDFEKALFSSEETDAEKVKGMSKALISALWKIVWKMPLLKKADFFLLKVLW